MTALLLIAVVLLVLANGFFVAAEFSLVRSRRSRLEELAAEGKAAAGRAVAVMDDLNQYLSACQLGITLASLGIGFLGEPAIAELFVPLLGFAAGHAAAVIAAYTITPSLHTPIGEQV